MLSLNLGKYKRNQDLNKIRQFCSRTASATSSISFKESRSRTSCRSASYHCTHERNITSESCETFCGSFRCQLNRIGKLYVKVEKFILSGRT